MKTAAFEYVRARSTAEALDALAIDPDESKILAGGQSLVPMMNFRLARPTVLVDINNIDALSQMHRDAQWLTIGATTRHLAVQNIAGSDPLARILRGAAAHIGHLPIRTMGTFGGSLAHCDAASEWCLIARLLDAEVVVTSSQDGDRTIAASEFFQSLFTTAMRPDELLTAARLPVLGDDHHTGFVEFARRAGDFAIVSVGVDLTVTDGAVSDARICVGGVDAVPHRATAAEEALVGAEWTNPTRLNQAVDAAAAAAVADIAPPSDAHGSGEYRRDLVRALIPRAIKQAAGHENNRSAHR